MFDVIAAKPSDYLRIKNKEIPVHDVLVGIAHMLKIYNNRDDSWRDDVYNVARKLSAAEFWDQINYDDLFEILMMDLTAVPWFLEGMPKQLRQEFNQYLSRG